MWGIWRPWLHFNLWSFLLLLFASGVIAGVTDTDEYKRRSETLLVEVVPDTFVFRENKFFPQVWMSEFQGVVDGRRRFFVILFYPGKSHHPPTARHERIYAVVNVDELAALGGDAGHPVPVLKYGVSSAMENFDYAIWDVNSGVVYDVYEQNVASYVRYNRSYGGVAIMDLVHVIYLWIGLPWGVGCGIYTVARCVRRRVRAAARGESRS